jgi:hypothetical protein
MPRELYSEYSVNHPILQLYTQTVQCLKRQKSKTKIPQKFTHKVTQLFNLSFLGRRIKDSDIVFAFLRPLVEELRGF